LIIFDVGIFIGFLVIEKSFRGISISQIHYRGGGAK
jgi:hypothetical protein